MWKRRSRELGKSICGDWGTEKAGEGGSVSSALKSYKAIVSKYHKAGLHQSPPFPEISPSTPGPEPSYPTGAPQSPFRNPQTPARREKAPPERQQTCTPAPSQLARASNFHHPWTQPNAPVLQARKRWWPLWAGIRAAAPPRTPPQTPGGGTRCCSPPGTQEAGGPRRASPQPRLPGRRRAPSSKSRRGSGAASARSGDPRAVAPSPCSEPAAGRAAASRRWVDSDDQAGTASAPGGGEDGAFCSSPPGSAQPQPVLPLTARPLAARAACARAPVTPEGGTVGRGCGAGAGRGAGTREPGAGGAS